MSQRYWSFKALNASNLCVKEALKRKWKEVQCYLYQTEGFTLATYIWKFSIQYMVPGFEPTTFRTSVSSHNH